MTEWKAIQTDWNAAQLMDDESNISVCLSQREVGILMSALTPFRWKTRWENLPPGQDLDFIDSLASKLMRLDNCAVDCGEVLDCIETSGDIQNAIQEITVNNNYGDRSTVIGGGNPVFDSCNEDIIFGATTYLVDYINTSIIDALEIIEVSTNFIEAIQLWAENAPFPIVGQLASRLLQAIAWIQDNIAENYLANYTTGLRDTYRCELFCLWMESPNCELTAGDLAIYFASRVGAESFFSTLADSITFLIAGVWSGPQIVDAMHALVMIAMTADDAIGWFSINGLYDFNVAVALGSNNPDGDWTILCACAVFYCRTWLDGDGFSPAWTLSAWIGGTATYDAVNDVIVGGKSVTPNTGAVADISIDTTGTEISSISVVISWLATRESDADGVYFILDGVPRQFTGIGTSGTSQTITYNPLLPVECDDIQLQIASAGNNAADAAFLTIEKITINGRGVNPFGVDNC